MITTSISLPPAYADLWRQYQRSILKTAVRTLRVALYRSAMRRGVPRRYNRLGIPIVIVTTRFTPAEYDTLHFVAATLRVSVSSLVYRMIQIWQKGERGSHRHQYVTNYDAQVCVWKPLVGSVTESLHFYPKNWFYRPQHYPKTRLTNTSSISRPIT